MEWEGVHLARHLSPSKVPLQTLLFVVLSPTRLDRFGQANGGARVKYCVFSPCSAGVCPALQDFALQWDAPTISVNRSAQRLIAAAWLCSCSPAAALCSA